MRRIFSLTTIIVMLVLAAAALLLPPTTAAIAHWQQTAMPTETATPSDTPRSLFEGDTCAPPCWFGLTAGVSTAEDVAAVVTGSDFIFRPYWGSVAEGTIDAQTGLVVDGSYEFSLGSWERGNAYADFPNSRLRISGGVLDTIRIIMPKLIYLEEALSLLGMPDEIRFVWAYDDTPYIEFIYWDEKYIPVLSIDIEKDPQELFPAELCSIETLHTFNIDKIFYYASEDRLYPSGNNRMRQIPLATWHSWLNGEVDMSCWEAWEQLPEEFVLPTIPTITPTPTATGTVQP